MKNIQKLLFLAVCLCTAFTANAQNLIVTGKVIDSEGLEVIGANITLKGSPGVGAISHLSGNYKIKVNNAAKDVTYVFSYIGMRTQEIHVKGKTTINVTLQSDAKALDEVVVVGYGTSKRSDLTGSVVSVKSEDLMRMPTSDVTQALAGRVAGVQITQSEGAPGSTISCLHTRTRWHFHHAEQERTSLYYRRLPQRRRNVHYRTPPRLKRLIS